MPALIVVIYCCPVAYVAPGEISLCEILEVFTFVAVQCNEDEQHDCESPHR